MVTSSPSEKPLPPCEISNDVSEIDFPCITIHNETIYAAPTPSPLESTSPPISTEGDPPIIDVTPCDPSNDVHMNNFLDSPSYNLSPSPTVSSKMQSPPVSGQNEPPILPPCQISNDVGENDFPCISIQNEILDGPEPGRVSNDSNSEDRRR